MNTPNQNKAKNLKMRHYERILLILLLGLVAFLSVQLLNKNLECKNNPLIYGVNEIAEDKDIREISCVCYPQSIIYDKFEFNTNGFIFQEKDELNIID